MPHKTLANLRRELCPMFHANSMGAMFEIQERNAVRIINYSKKLTGNNLL